MGVVDFRITSKSWYQLEKSFELWYNATKPTTAVIMYPKGELSPLDTIYAKLLTKDLSENVWECMIKRMMNQTEFEL